MVLIRLKSNTNKETSAAMLPKCLRYNYSHARVHILLLAILIILFNQISSSLSAPVDSIISNSTNKIQTTNLTKETNETLGEKKSDNKDASANNNSTTISSSLKNETAANQTKSEVNGTITRLVEDKNATVNENKTETKPSSKNETISKEPNKDSSQNVTSVPTKDVTKGTQVDQKDPPKDKQEEKDPSKDKQDEKDPSKDKQEEKDPLKDENDDEPQDDPNPELDKPAEGDSANQIRPPNKQEQESDTSSKQKEQEANLPKPPSYVNTSNTL